jgi:hypothetical protein
MSNLTVGLRGLIVVLAMFGVSGLLAGCGDESPQSSGDESSSRGVANYDPLYDPSLPPPPWAEVPGVDYGDRATPSLSSPDELTTPPPPPPPSTVEQQQAEEAKAELDELVGSTASPREQMRLVMEEFCDTWVWWENMLLASSSSPDLYVPGPGSDPYYVSYEQHAAEYFDKAALDDWQANTDSPGQLPPTFREVWPDRCYQ